MEFAASLYKGGTLFAASKCDYTSSRELGLICPFCRESVFLAKGFTRTVRSQEQEVAASWRHYRVTTGTAFCDRRALSKEGKQELKLLQKPAQNQRLKLFNRRFWEIFKHNKAIPPNLKKFCLKFVSAATLDKMVAHCHERWHVEQILRSLPKKISSRLSNPDAVEAALWSHPALQDSPPEIINSVVDDFVKTKFTVLRHKILGEVIAWLGTKSAYDSFEKLIALSLVYCLEALPPPIHSQTVAEMAVVSLTLTDWEDAIASLDSKTRAIGFG